MAKQDRATILAATAMTLQTIQGDTGSDGVNFRSCWNKFSSTNDELAITWGDHGYFHDGSGRSHVPQTPPDRSPPLGSHNR